MVERLNVDFVDDEEPGSNHEWKSGPAGELQVVANHHRGGDISNSGDNFLSVVLMFWTADADNSFSGRAVADQ